jgi:HD superfamily phosphohydrolase
MPKQQRIRDPLHDLVEFDEGSHLENVLWRVIQTRPFQRLRRIKQLGFSDYVYPGATHSRLIHSIGVFHTARRLMRVIEKHVSPYEVARGHQALAAALVHDLGHGPFSHAFEKLGERFGLKMADHEAVSDILIRKSEVADVLRDLGSGFPDDVADIVRSAGTRTIYSAVVSSQFDADRLDYMRRDRLMTGSEHAAIDFEWLVENLEVGLLPYGVDQTSLGQVQTFVLGRKAIFAAEAYVLGLFQLYPTIYLHKTTRGVEKLCTELLARVLTLVTDGSSKQTGLPLAHPIVKFARHPDQIDAALALDDTVVWGALSLLAEAKDQCISDLATRLRDRKLYKCIDVRACIAQANGDAQSTSPEADTICANISKELMAWSEKHKDGAPRILIDEAARSPYNRLTESKGPLNQIHIRTEGDKLVDLAERSKVVAQLETYKAFRVYHGGNDMEAMGQINQIISARVTSWQ